MGYKIEIDAVVVSIWTNGFFANMTIRDHIGGGGWTVITCPVSRIYSYNSL